MRVTRRNRFSERGAILVLIEILLVGILLMVGLALDTAVVTTSKSEQRQSAEQVALESLHTYHSTAGPWNAKLQAAKSRAESIAGVNFFIGKPFLEDPSETSALAVGSPNGQNGAIYPGMWYFRPPAICPSTASGCPCNSTGTYTGPCFEEYTAAEYATREPNSFRVVLKFSNTSRYKTVFMHLKGADTVMLSSEATAALIPRHGVFLIDLSRSSHSDTHMPYESASGAQRPIKYAGESAFKVNSSCQPVLPNTPNGCMTQNVCSILGGSYPGLYDAMWNTNSGLYGMLATPPARLTIPPGMPVDIRKHYRSDYQCYLVSYTDDRTGPETDNYLVDADTHAVSTAAYPGEPVTGYQGPEPLVSMLDGVNYALTELEKNKVPGDYMGAIGIDRSASIRERTFAMSPPDLNAATPYGELVYLSDIATQSSASIQDRYQGHFFFPRLNASLNFPEALERARDMLRNTPDANNAENFIVLMSDGITNCNGNRLCDSPDSEQAFSDSFIETENYVDQNLVPDSIKLHFILLGDNVGPHTLVYKSNRYSDRCMVDTEARTDPSGAIDFVESVTGNAPFMNAMRYAAGQYYFGPNKFYRLVRKTDGVWGPVRRACQYGVNLSPALNSTCKNASANSSPPFSKITSSNPSLPRDSSGNPVADGYGRLMCDIAGRSRREQIREYMGEILSRTPYTVVRVKQESLQ